MLYCCPSILIKHRRLSFCYRNYELFLMTNTTSPWASPGRGKQLILTNLSVSRFWSGAVPLACVWFWNFALLLGVPGTCCRFPSRVGFHSSPVNQIPPCMHLRLFLPNMSTEIRLMIQIQKGKYVLSLSPFHIVREFDYLKFLQKYNQEITEIRTCFVVTWMKKIIYHL